MSAIEWADVRRRFPGLSWDELAQKVRDIHNAALDHDFGVRRRIPQHVLEGEENVELDVLDDDYDLAGDEITETSFGYEPIIDTALSETTPLIGVAETASVVPSVLAGGAVIAGSAGIGKLISDALAAEKSEEEEHTDPLFTLPGHKYIGPGNTIDKGASPIDYDDEISEIHDREYANAKSQLDIYDADSKYLNKAIYDTFARGNVHSAIGAVGIGAKHAIEKVIGVKYPAGLPKDNSDGLIDNTIDDSFLNPSGT